MRRVVVTGLGIVSPLGSSAQKTWDALLKGQSGIGPITRFDASQYSTQFAGEVKDFEVDKYVHKKEQKKMDLFIQYSMGAASMALEDSGLKISSDAQAFRSGVIVSAGMGGLPAIEATYDTVLARGPSRITPFFIPMVIPNLASGQIAITHNFKGPNLCVTTACSSGAHSIGEAYRYIRDGVCDSFLAGGAESTICKLAVGGFGAMRALSQRNDAPQKASRPFDKDRDGFVLAEGAAVLVLEALETAQKRGARILAEVSGYGLSCDAYHMTSPSETGEGAARCMQMAIDDQKTDLTTIGYINAHGTSTPAGDGQEVNGVKKVFGEHAKKLAMSSTKSMTGHLLGAAGAIEAAFSVLAIRDSVMPPTINLETPSAECDLDFVPGEARQKRLEAVLTNSFGFGGTNASLIFKRFS